MTAAKGPQGITGGDEFTTPLGRKVVTVEWLARALCWHCRYTDKVYTVEDREQSYVYLRHEFLLRHCERIKG